MKRNRYIGDRQFYAKVLAIAIPVMIQNGITNFVNMLDNIMVGMLGTEAMSGVSIVNQFLFVFNLLVFGAVSAAGIFTAQYFGSGDTDGVRYTFRFKLYTCLVCSDQKEEITPTTTWGHLWDEGEITTAPTCSSDGVRTFFCTREGCDGIKTEVIATEWWNHTWQDATCEAPKSCKYCDLTEGESLGGHIWDEGQITTEPSCSEGEKTYTCQRENCQTIKTEEIEPIYDHVFETTENEIEIDGKFFYEEACECGQTRPGEEIEKTEEPEAPSNETEE